MKSDADTVLWGYLGDYCDGTISAGVEPQFRDRLRTQNDKQLVDRFRIVRGRLQMALQGYYLQKKDLMRLQDFVESKAARETQEAIKIAEIGRWEIMGDVRRRLTLVGIIGVLVGIAVYTFSPPRPKQINPLEFFAYEAIAFEDDPAGRLDLPSHDLAEVQSYFNQYPGLKMAPKVVRPASGWEIDGASVLDYDAYKAGVVQYSNTVLGERMFQFTMPGLLSELPRSEQGNEGGLVYQAYRSDRLLFVAWQHDENVLAFMVGKRSAPEMARFAAAGR
jgi:hypothetical protein